MRVGRPNTLGAVPVDFLTPPTVTVRGVAEFGIGDYAKTVITDVLHRAHGTVRQVRISVTRLADPASLVASAHVDVDGALVHTQAQSGTARSAVDQLARRLSVRLGARRRQPVDRSVVTRRLYGAARCSVAQAITDLEALGYEFHLFTHESGADCVVRRIAGCYLLATATGAPIPTDHLPVWESDQPAPQLTDGQARAQLGRSGDRMLFYIGPDQRGRLMHRLAYGGYGLITRAPER